MFDVAPTELLLVAVIALVVIGPKDLPRAMRFVGQWVGKARRMNAVQVNLGNLVEAEFAGIEAGLYNRTGSLTGLQAGLFNDVAHDVNGFQFGLFNSADDVNGFQVGFLNRTVSLRGIQIGLVNVNEGGPVTFFPFINGAF